MIFKYLSVVIMNIVVVTLLCLGYSATTRTFTLVSMLDTTSLPSSYTLTITDAALRGQVSSLFTLNACLVYSFYGSLDKNHFYMTRDTPSVTTCDLPLISLPQVQEAWGKAFFFSFSNGTLTFFCPDNKPLMVYSSINTPLFSIVGVWNVIGGSSVGGKTTNATIGSITIDNTTITAWSSSYSYKFTQPTITTTKVDAQGVCGSSASVFCAAMDSTVAVKVYSLKHWCFWSKNNTCLLELNAV